MPGGYEDAASAEDIKSLIKVLLQTLLKRLLKRSADPDSVNTRAHLDELVRYDSRNTAYHLVATSDHSLVSQHRCSWPSYCNTVTAILYW